MAYQRRIDFLTLTCTAGIFFHKDNKSIQILKCWLKAPPIFQSLFVWPYWCQERHFEGHDRFSISEVFLTVFEEPCGGVSAASKDIFKEKNEKILPFKQKFHLRTYTNIKLRWNNSPWHTFDKPKVKLKTSKKFIETNYSRFQKYLCTLQFWQRKRNSIPSFII